MFSFWFRSRDYGILSAKLLSTKIAVEARPGCSERQGDWQGLEPVISIIIIIHINIIVIIIIIITIIIITITITIIIIIISSSSSSSSISQHAVPLWHRVLHHSGKPCGPGLPEAGNTISSCYFPWRSF